jgi:phosphoglycolate phosphatase
MGDSDFSGVRAVVFDLDGTLIDSEKDLVTSVNAMLRQVGRHELAEELIASFVGSGASVLVSRALGEGTGAEDVKKALAIFLGHYEQHKLDVTRAYPGVEETLQELQARDCPLAVLTNKPTEISKRILEALGLSRYFRLIYGGNSFPSKKPDPLGARTILREFGIAAEQGLMVGDSEVDVQTARNAGMRVVAVNYGFGTHDRGAHPADAYVDRPEELLPLISRGK